MNTKSYRRLILAGGIIAVAVAGAWLLEVWRDEAPAPPGEQEPLRVGLACQPSGAVAVLAARQGYYADEGLNAVVRDYPSGKRALIALLDGEVDVINTAEAPVALAGFKRDDFVILATIGSSTGLQHVIARKDRGIVQPADLRGKRIATQRGSAVHFFLHLFLAKHGLAEGDVKMVFLKAEELPPALAEGRIDAFCMREPFISQALTLLGERAVVFSDPGLYVTSELVVARRDAVRRRRGQLARLLRAMVRAEDVLRKRPLEGRKAVALAIGANEEELAQVWQRFDPRVGLDQMLFSELEEVTRWGLAGGYAEDAPMPNFLTRIDPGPLDAVKPEAVTIIR